MSATNHTTNYELPIFVGSDKPAWLVDWNGAMTAIDTAIHTAEGKADQAGTDIGGIESSISTINSTLTSINNAVSQLRIDTNANTGSINTITSLIGNGEPTTTDKTIIGAINEIVAYHEIDSYTGEFTVTPVSGLSINSDDRSLIKYALNSTKSFGKIYGSTQLNADGTYVMSQGWNKVASITASAMPTISESYYIEVGMAFMLNTARDQTIPQPARLKFNTNGSVDIEIYRGTSSYTPPNGSAYSVSLAPCMYILKDIGD